MAAISIGEIEATLRLRDELTSQLKVAQQQLASTGDNLQKIGRQAREAGSIISISLTIPLAAAGTAALKFSTDFQTAMTKVGNLTNIGVEGIADMRKEILKLSPAVGVGPKELADGLLVVASTGLKGAAAMDVLEQSAKATAVGLGDTKDVARAVTAAITAYGADALDASEATNKLFVAVREGGAEASEFAGTLGRVVGIASQVGVSFDEVLASMATFTRLGVGADEAATALRGTMATILKPSKDAREQLIGLGTSLEELRKNVKEKGLTAALTELVHLAEGNEDALAAIIPNVRALSGVMGTAGSQAESYAATLDAVKSGTTELDEAFEVTSDTLGFKWNVVVAKAQGVLLRFGDAIAPTFGKLIEAIEPLLSAAARMTETFADLPEPVKAAAVAFGLLLAAIGPLVLVVGSFTTVAGYAATGLSSLAAFFTTATVAAGVNSAAMAVNTTATLAQTAATKAAADALKFAAGEQLAFSFMAKEGSQMLLPLSGNIMAVGKEATKAAVPIGLLARALGVARTAFSVLSGPVGLAIAAFTAVVTATGSWPEVGRILKSVAEIIKNQVVKEFDTFAARAKFWVTAIENVWEKLDKLVGFSHLGASIKAGLGHVADGLESVALATGKGNLEESIDQAKKKLEEINRLKLAASAGGIDPKKTMDFGVSLNDGQTRAVRSMAMDLGDAQEQLAKLTAEQKANIAAGQKMGLEVSDITTRLKQQFPALEVTEAAVQLYSVALDDMKDKAKEANKVIEDQKEALDDMRLALIPLTAEEQKFVIEQTKAGHSADEIAKALKLTQKPVADFVDRMEEFKEAAPGAEIADVATKINALTGPLMLINRDVLDAAASFDKWQESMRKSAERFPDLMGSLKDLPKLFSHLQEEIPTDMFGVGGRALQGLKDTLAAAPKIIMDAFTGGGGLKGAGMAIGSLLGSSVMSNMFGKSGVNGLLKNFTGLFGKVMESAAPVIGALVGPIIDLLVKAFDKKRADFKRMGRELGQDFSDALIDKLKADSKKFGGEVQAVLVNLPTIIKEAGGVMEFGLDKAIAKARDLFVMLETGALSAKQVGKTFDEVFALILPEAINDTTGFASAAFLELIDLAHRFGIEVDGVTKFLSDMSAKAIKGLNQIAAGTFGSMNDAFDALKTSGADIDEAAKKVDGLKKEIADLKKKGIKTDADRRELRLLTAELDAAQKALDDLRKKQKDAQSEVAKAAQGGQEAFDRFGRLAVVSFAAALASGEPVLDILEEMGPALDEAARAQENFGLKATGAFGELVELRKFVKENKELIGTLDGVNNMMVGLKNSGMLTQSVFDDLNAIARETFDEMVKKGLPARQALILMQPTLQRIWELQTDFGFAVDEGTQKLIDQGIEAGIVGEQHRSASDRMVIALEHVAEVIDLIAIAFGVTMPEAAEQGAKDAQDALDGIEIPDFKFPNEFPTDFPPVIVGPDVAQFGGRVTPQGIQHFEFGGMAHGRDTVPALLSPGETVRTPQQEAQVQRERSRGSQVVVKLYLREEEIANVLVDGASKDGKVLSKLSRLLKQVEVKRK